MDPLRYLLLNPDEPYPFGIVAGPSSLGQDELHGPFPTEEEANEYRKWLRSEFSDYEYTRLVKIETPQVGVG